MKKVLILRSNPVSADPRVSKIADILKEKEAITKIKLIKRLSGKFPALSIRIIVAIASKFVEPEKPYIRLAP